MTDYNINQAVTSNSGGSADFQGARFITAGKHTSTIYRDDGTVWAMGDASGSYKDGAGYRLTTGVLGNLKNTASSAPVRVGVADVDTLFLGHITVTENNGTTETPASLDAVSYDLWRALARARSKSWRIRSSTSM